MRPTRRRRSRDEGDTRRAPSRAALVLLALALVLGPLAFGGVFGWSIALIGVLAGLSATMVAWTERGAAVRVEPICWLAVAGVAMTAFQLLPLPRALTSAIQPEAVIRHDAAAGLLGAEPAGALPITLSPHGTTTELVKGGALLAAFFAAWVLAASGRRRAVLYTVAGSTLAMALVALGHALAGASAAFGVHETPSPLPAPLMNPNQLSGFLAMGVPLILGLGLDDEVRARRNTHFVVAALVGATALLSVSRGGAVSLLCGVFALALFGLVARRRSPRDARSGRAALTSIAAALAATLALGLYVGAEALSRDFQRGDLSKLELSANALSVALDHPWLGVGRGAFSSAFVARHGSEVRYTHPENFVAQWASEWGIPFTLALLAALLLVYLRVLRRARSWSKLGALAALLSIGVHDLVDFSMERLGVGVVVAALLAATVAPRRAGRTAAGRRPFGAHALALASGALALVLVASLGWRLDARSVPRLQASLERSLSEREDGRFETTLQDALRAHPGEPAFALLAGTHAVQTDGPNALRWLTRAMHLAPGWDAPHAETARWLLRRGRYGQAFLEVMEAEHRRKGGGAQLACRVLTRRPELAPHLVRAAGDYTVGQDTLDAVSACVPFESPASEEIDRELLAGGRAAAHVREAKRALRRGAPADALEALLPVASLHDLGVARAWVRSLLRAGRHEEAAEAAERALAWARGDEAILRGLAEAHAGADDAEAMRAALTRLRARSAGRPRPLARAWLLEGDLETDLGNAGRAFQAYERAHRLDPATEALLHSGRLAEQLGRRALAHQTYVRACRHAGAGSNACRAKERLQRSLREQAPHLEQLNRAP